MFDRVLPAALARIATIKPSGPTSSVGQLPMTDGTGWETVTPQKIIRAAVRERLRDMIEAAWLRRTGDIPERLPTVMQRGLNGTPLPSWWWIFPAQEWRENVDMRDANNTPSTDNRPETRTAEGDTETELTGSELTPDAPRAHTT